MITVIISSQPRLALSTRDQLPITMAVQSARAALAFLHPPGPPRPTVGHRRAFVRTVSWRLMADLARRQARDVAAGSAAEGTPLVVRGCSVPSIGSGSWPLTWHLLEGTGQLRTSAHHSHRVGRCAFGTATAKPGPSYALLTHPMLIGVARNGVDKYGCQAWAKRPKGDSSRPDAET